MEDIGFRGAGSRFNSRFTEDDAAGLAKQLNDLAQGVQAGLPMPYIGEGQVVSYIPGGSQIYQTDDNFQRAGGQTYFNQFKCVVSEKSVAGGGTVWALQVVNGTVVYEDEHQAMQESMTVVAPTVPSTVQIVDGSNPSSIFMNNGGYYELVEGKDWGVYLIQLRSNDRVKFRNYVYVADTDTFVYPSGDFVAYSAEDVPSGLDAPRTAYSMQVLEVAFITWNEDTSDFSVSQELIGSQTIPSVDKPVPFEVEVINRNADPSTAPLWAARVAKGVVMSPPDVDACINVEWIKSIEDGSVGAYDDSLWCDNGGAYEYLDNSTDYDVYLFRITLSSTGETYYKLWLGTSSDFVDSCPVELPSGIAPSGDYVAQAIHIASMTQPYSADAWNVEQVVQGTVSFPAYVPDVCTPFKVRKTSSSGGSTDYEVCEGTVNNIVPSNIADPITVADGDEAYVWIVVGVGTGTPPLFPDPENVTVDSGASIPTDTDAESYIGIAHIQTDGTVSPLVRGSVWASRIKVGDDDAVYYYAGI